MDKRKQALSLALLILSNTAALLAQKQQGLDADNTGPGHAAKNKQEWLALHPEASRTLTVDILGLAAQSFSVSNQADGPGDGMGYNRTEHISVGLLTNSKDTAYRLLFYSKDETFQRIVDTEGTLRTVYFPMYMYGDIRQKLEQAILQKKRPQLKIVLRKEGYSEAALLF